MERRKKEEKKKLERLSILYYFWFALGANISNDEHPSPDWLPSPARTRQTNDGDKTMDLARDLKLMTAEWSSRPTDRVDHSRAIEGHGRVVPKCNGCNCEGSISRGKASR